MDSLEGEEEEVVGAVETRAEEEGKEGRKDVRTVVLGIRTDAKSRELLTWALVNVAVPGDRVVAVHVRRFSSSSAECLDPFEKELEPMRKAYEGFCCLRQIDLVIKICSGFSVRRTLVRQVKMYSASHLILGEAKSCTALRSSLTSIPKYCAKWLPHECSVVAVNNGKIVFERRAVDRKVMGYRCRISRLLLEFRKSMIGDSLDCQLLIKEQEESINDNSSSGQSNSSGFEDGLSCSPSIDLNHSSTAVDSLQEDKCSVCGTVSTSQCSSKERFDELQHEPKADTSVVSNVAPCGVQETTDQVRSSWFALRRAMATHRRTISIDGSRSSLVQWTKWISGRSSTSSPNSSVGKHWRPGTLLASRADKDLDLYPFYLEEGSLQFKLESLQEKYACSCKLFSYKELVQATCDFSADRLIGKGGSSRVYKGILPDGEELAVKTLKLSKDAVQEFVLEIDIITSLNHKNIISLVGFCFENSLILIYDFLFMGSLEDNLHGREEHKSSLNWSDRYKISIGIAKALDYLHGNGAPETIIHMDVKSSNILLSESLEPKLSDFGLARRPTESISGIACNKNLAGTFGYLAPEYFMFGQISTKTDVYAFGVVLLELLSGRKPIETGGTMGATNLVMWAKPMLQTGRFHELVDPTLEEEYDGEQMERMILAASLCLFRDPQSRPAIPCVLKLLQGDLETVNWGKLQVDASETGESFGDDSSYLSHDIKSHHTLLMPDFENDSPSASSSEHTADFTTDSNSMEDYLQGRLSSLRRRLVV
ncbi:hypothetical protein HPP92_002010 [Vanilla planifolia]|uniref:Protein kinase domain-containing protein n=1 Tax=Vanilla planifolia TaxID=51239 RepID=A0A835VE38_VANPL|nr:hypothetical protein HPP92_002010 [Vanilla planifolia]